MFDVSTIMFMFQENLPLLMNIFEILGKVIEFNLWIT